MAVQDDFDPKDALTAISAKLDQPDKFARIFCDAAQKQKEIDSVLKDIIKNLISHDNETIMTIKEYQRQVDKEDLKNSFKKFGGFLYSIIMLLIGALIAIIAAKLSH